jgi:glutathione S-transferase
VKLLSDATTPFGRKVLVAAIERAIVLDEVFVPLDGTGALDASNPLRQIPTLVLEDGRSLYDSDVILQYLDTCHQAEPLIPEEGRFDVLTRMALGSGLIEATLLRRMETVRIPQEQSAAFIGKMEQRIHRVLAALDKQLATLANTSGGLRGDQITVGCALGYVDFRYTESWREKHPRLSEWYGDLVLRPSMVATVPTRSTAVRLAQFSRD